MNWNKIKDIDMNSKTGRDLFIDAINKSVFSNKVTANTQEFMSAMPQRMKNIIDKGVIGTADADMEWQKIFAEVDLRGTIFNSYTVDAIESNITFNLTLAGEDTKIYSLDSTTTDVPVNTYSAGVGFPQQLFDDQEYYRMEDVMNQFTAKYYDKLASIHYGLLTASGAGNNTAWVAGADTPTRDIATISAGCLKLITNGKLLGLGITPATKFYLVSQLSMMDRVRKALIGTYGIANPSGNSVGYNVEPIFTSYLSDSLGYLVVPGKLNKRAVREDLHLHGNTDIVSWSQTLVGRARFGANLNADQVTRLANA